MRNEEESILIQIEHIFGSIVGNTHNVPHVMEWVKELKEKCILTKVYDISDELFNIVKTMEDIVLKGKQGEELRRLLYPYYNEACNVLYSISNKRLLKLQEELEKTNIEDFNIIYKDEDKLIVAGSFDFAYYHELEITFFEVDFIQCPGRYFSVKKIRFATEEEVKQLATTSYGNHGGFTVCFEYQFMGEGEKDKFFICAHEADYKWETVFYYNRENLQPDERIADWVPKDSPKR